MINSEATVDFISLAIVQKLKISTVLLKSLLPVITIDGQILKAGSITHPIVLFKLTINQNPLTLFMANHINLPLVLGTIWLQYNDPTIK